MRLILATFLSMIMLAGQAVNAGVLIDMPAPRKPAKVNFNVAAAAADVASAPTSQTVDVGELALARYSGAREGTYDNYYDMPYRNYSYPWPGGWGVWGWPWWGFGFGCVTSCSPCGKVCR